MYKRKIYVSFDYEKDKTYKYLMEAWNANPDFEFTFDDRSPNEIDTDSVYVVKQVLSRKINEATTIIVLAGKDINSYHRDSQEIGCINWQNYEVAKAVELNKNIIVVKLNNGNDIPIELYGQYYTLVNHFSQSEILEALNVIV